MPLLPLRSSELPHVGLPLLARAALALLALVLPAMRPASAQGLSSTRALLAYETGQNPAYPPVAGDELGYAVATCDFDNDGADDLAIGMPGDDQSFLGIPDVGQVLILWGEPGTGLSLNRSKYLWQGGVGSVDDPESGDRFGESLAAGNFDGDGYCDLAIGVPGEQMSFLVNAGAVEIRYGAPDRSDALTFFRQFFHEGTTGVPDNLGPGEEFGHVLAAADFDQDGRDDLAIGVPNEIAGGQIGAGRVFVLAGSPTGITTTGAEVWDLDSPGLDFHSPTPDFHFGWALAAADFDQDGFDDLAIGEPMRSDAGWGLVFILPGSDAGLTSAGAQEIGQGFGGAGDLNEVGDLFGYSLAVGRLNAGSYPDLVVGVPGEALPTGPGLDVDDAGAIHIFPGSSSGLLGAGSIFITPLFPGVPGDPETGDHFGLAVTTGDFDRDGYDDVAVGVPSENNFGAGDEGDVIVLRGSASGPNGTGAAQWNLQVPGILGDMNGGDRLGWCLATGDFDASGHADLAAGTPYDGGIGGVMVLYGALFADNFETASTARWSSTTH